MGVGGLSCKIEKNPAKIWDFVLQRKKNRLVSSYAEASKTDLNVLQVNLVF